MTSSLIKYRINSVTSQSAQYPAANLTDQSSTNGWQSDYSPTYPQEINLQFFTPIRTKTLKLTFHQYKIPTLVEVFVRLTAKQNYRKLGFIIPNDNSQSSFQHKEIKTLYFEFPCNFIKLVFYQCYKNEMNLFQQVALQDLKIEGQAMTYNEIKNIDLAEMSSADESDMGDYVQENQSNQQSNKIKQQNINNNMLIQTAGNQDLNQRFDQLYNYLQGQKQDAVQKQDFKLAGYLKNVIQSFKANQTQIASLQIQKKQALQDEDFDKCHRIKLQIQKRKQQFQYRVQQLYQNQQNFMAQYSHSRILPDPQRILTDRKHEDNNRTDKKTDGIKNFISSTPEREYETSLGKNKSGLHQQQQKRLSLNLNPQNNFSAVSQNKSINSEKIVDHDQQIIPAVRNKLMGIKQENQHQYPPNTNRSTYEESKNYSSVGGSKTNLQQQKKKTQKPSPRAKNARSKSPPKSPAKKVVTKKSQVSYVSVGESNMSLKSPILSYEQIQYRQQQKVQQYQQQIKQQTFSPTSKKQNMLSPYQQQQLQQQQQQQIQRQFQPLQQLIQKLKKLQVQPLDLKLRMKLQSHFSIIYEPYWQMIMHKSWSVKKQALQHVRDNVTIDNKQAYMAVMQFISFSINDPHPQVLLNTLSILRKLIQQGNANAVQFTLPHMPYFIETIVNSLLSLINSTNKQLSEQAYNLYLMLGMINFLTIQYLVQKLIKHKQTTKVTPQYTVLKISLMISLIEKYQQTTKYFKDILLWTIEFLKDPNNKVRSQASYVLLILVDIVGEDKAANSIKDKPQLTDLFNQVLNNSQMIEKSRLESLSNLGDGGLSSRLMERNQSKLEEINNSSVIGNNNKSGLSKQRGQVKNKSQIPQKKQQQQQQQKKRQQNPWTITNQQKPKSNINSRSKIQSQRNDDELEYSKQSDFYGSSVKKQNPSNIYVNRGYSQSQLSENVLDHTDGQMRVMEDDDNGRVGGQQQQDVRRYGERSYEGYYGEQQQDQQEEQQQEDTGKCDYCFMDMQGKDQRQHLLTQCKVLISCQQCMGRVYIRQTIYHLMNQCTNHTYHQQCRKCGLVFNINEINEHVGQGLCRLQRGEGWERCQFCGQDVMANDMKWVDHAYKCTNLPQAPEGTEKHSQLAD